MELAKQRALLIQDYKAFLSVLDSKGVGFSSPYEDKELEGLDLSDLKRLVGTVRELARTPTGPQ